MEGKTSIARFFKPPGERSDTPELSEEGRRILVLIGHACG